MAFTCWSPAAACVRPRLGPQVLEPYSSDGGGGDAASPAAGGHPRYAWDHSTGSLRTLSSGDGAPDAPLADAAGGSLDLVAPGLFVGDLPAASHLALLVSRGVTHVVNCLGPEYEAFPEQLAYLTIAVSDVPHEPIARHFDAVVDFIGAALAAAAPAPAAPPAVLVHCAEGVSRSSTLACAFLMRARGLSAAAALAALQAARPQAQPNESFLEQLRAWEETCAGRPPWQPPPPAAAASSKGGRGAGSGSGGGSGVWAALTGGSTGGGGGGGGLRSRGRSSTGGSGASLARHNSGSGGGSFWWGSPPPSPQPQPQPPARAAGDSPAIALELPAAIAAELRVAPSCAPPPRDSRREPEERGD